MEKEDGGMRRLINKIRISSGFILGFLGIIVAAFIPMAILLLENGVETRIDRLIINDLLNFEWFFGTIFALVLLAIAKVLVEKKEFLIARIFDLVSLALVLSLVVCSYVIYKNTTSWLNDVPVSLATDDAYTSNPMLDSSLPMNRGQLLAVRPKEISSYKKKARIAYIENADSVKEQELRWEIFFNDVDTYKYEGGNDFWIYVWKYYAFLSSMSDDDMDVILRGFENINTHVGNIGASVDDRSDCAYMISTLYQLKFEKSDWRAELWAGLVGRYMTVALIDLDVREDTRTCWLGSLPQYLSDKELDVGGDAHLKMLANALWNDFNSFEVQTSSSRAMFYSDVPQYIVDFYAALSDSASTDDFYEYIKSMTRQ